jgi:hypothetical protein
MKEFIEAENEHERSPFIAYCKSKVVEENLTPTYDNGQWLVSLPFRVGNKETICV